MDNSKQSAFWKILLPSMELYQRISAKYQCHKDRQCLDTLLIVELPLFFKKKGNEKVLRLWNFLERRVKISKASPAPFAKAEITKWCEILLFIKYKNQKLDRPLVFENMAPLCSAAAFWLNFVLVPWSWCKILGNTVLYFNKGSSQTFRCD